MRHTILIATTTLLAAGAFVLFGGALRESPSAGASALPAERVAAAFDPAFSSAQNAASLVLRLQQQIRQSPDDAASHALLGLAYEQRARETGDAAYYPRAEAVLRAGARARRRERRGASPVSPRSRSRATASARHSSSRGALARWRPRRRGHSAPSATRSSSSAATARRSRPSTSWRGSSRASRPTPASRTRVSCSATVAGAVAAMRLAAETAVPGSEAAAWTALQLGKLFFIGRRPHERGAGVPHRARPCPRIRSRFRRPRIGRGRSEAADPGRSPSKDGRSRPCPCPSTSPVSATSCSGPAGQGRPPASTPSSAPSIACQRANGVKTDLELALFRIDHGRGLGGGHGARRYTAYRTRPSVDAADVVAWGLARSGRCAEARRYSKLALRLGTEDSPEVLPSRDDRALPRQRQDAAERWLRRALDLNPGFSLLWSPVAARYAR